MRSSPSTRRETPPPRGIVRHQNEIAAGQRDIRRERRALVAALVLVDLDDEFHAFAQLVLGPDAAAASFSVPVVAASFEILARDFLEREKAMAVGAVVDEAGLEAWFDAGDDRLVDVALSLLLAGGFDVEVDQLLAIDNGHP